MPFGVHSWWLFLCALAVFNVAAWTVIAMRLARRRNALAPQEYSLHRAQLVLSALYVGGCAFRSFFPVYDVPRICVVDSWLSTVLIGRSVATIAEVSFAAQWALLLREAARVHGYDGVLRISRLIVPFIVIAELCSWTAVLTTANLGHVFENSLWGVSAALIASGLIALVPRWPARGRVLAGLWIVAGCAYVAYMFLVDVPMYWARWSADQAAAKDYLSLAQGVADASACKLASQRWEDWRHEVVWMTLYFSGGVWASLSLVLAVPRRPHSSAGS
jgi:hypothetical protein